MKKNKDFDCVEMQDREALRIHEELKGKTREEQLAYWRERNEEARKVIVYLAHKVHCVHSLCELRRAQLPGLG